MEGISKQSNLKIGKDYTGIACGAFILNHKNELLLTKRSNSCGSYEGEWSVPGGKNEFGEKLEETTIRETKEEVGVDVEVIRLLDHFNYIPNDGEHWVYFNFICKIIGGELKIMEPDKIDEIRWFPLTELPEDTTSYTRAYVEKYLKENN